MQAPLTHRQLHPQALALLLLFRAGRTERLWRVTPRGPRLPAWAGVHALLEVGPALPGRFDLRSRYLGRPLRERMQHDDEALGSRVEHAVVLASTVAPQLA